MLDTFAPCFGHRWLARLPDHELSWLQRPYNARSHGGRVMATKRLCVDCGRANRISAARMKFCDFVRQFYCGWMPIQPNRPWSALLFWDVWGCSNSYFGLHGDTPDQRHAIGSHGLQIRIMIVGNHLPANQWQLSSLLACWQFCCDGGCGNKEVKVPTTVVAGTITWSPAERWQNSGRHSIRNIE